MLPTTVLGALCNHDKAYPVIGGALTIKNTHLPEIGGAVTIKENASSCLQFLDLTGCSINGWNDEKVSLKCGRSQYQ